jgi:hypothetical protein
MIYIATARLKHLDIVGVFGKQNALDNKLLSDNR